jgi:hypothetical protein
MPLLHQMQMSGNCYKARLAARQAGCELTLRDYPLLGGETRKPEFLAKNANVVSRCSNGKTAARCRNPTPSSGISAKDRISRLPMRGQGHKLCHGCSLNNTVTSLTSP